MPKTRLSRSASALLFVTALSIPTLSLAIGQKGGGNRSEAPEMLMVEGGFLAIDTPKGWLRSQGPGLAFFLEKGSTRSEAQVWIYIDQYVAGSGAQAKSLRDFVRSDVDGFKERFKSGVAQEEAALDLPKVKSQAAVISFRSGEQHNAFEEVMYIQAPDRILTLVLSAKTEPAFAKTLPVFREFARSYGGMIVLAPEKQP